MSLFFFAKSSTIVEMLLLLTLTPIKCFTRSAEVSIAILFIILSKFILPKISNNLETRKSQILENIEVAEKQREDSENKIKEFEKIILKSKNDAKNYFNTARQKVLNDINKKKGSFRC